MATDISQFLEILNTEASLTVAPWLSNDTEPVDPETTVDPWTPGNNSSNITKPLIPSGEPLLQLRDEPWVLPLLVLSSINIGAILIFEIYILIKSCGTRRHLFLGQVLLFGLFLCSMLGYAFILQPRWFLCAITRAGVGLAYSIMFSTLLVKCLFLLGLHSGIYINSAFQSILLFFAIGIQIAISSQWLVYRPSYLIRVDDPTVEDVCEVTPFERVLYLSYVMFLMLMVIVASVRARSLKENNKEALYIGAAIGILVVIWVSWMAVLIIFERRFEDPAQGFGLVCSSLIVFLLVFIPKAVQLAIASRKNGSTNGSQSMVFTPSFLNLQPHAVLPGGDERAVVKRHSSAADYCRRYPIWHTDCPPFHQMAPPPIATSDNSSQPKSNKTFVRQIA